MVSPARSAGNGFRPQPFGRYTLLRRIGAGGMGEIYLAKQSGAAGVEKLCVVKKVLPHLTDDPSFSKRFLDEAKVAVQLTHGNICQVFDVGEVDENLYLAMEYVEGKTIGKLAARVRERGMELPAPIVLWLGARLCDGLSYAHRKTDQGGRPLGVVHRDISPNNVIVTYEGEVKIIDFGAAKSTVKEEKTAPRLVIGNITYMAPEQARKQYVDRRADIYAGAVVLYELLTNRTMPTTGDFVERWRRAANPSFEPVSSHNPRLPAELDGVFRKALASNPEERYYDAEAFRDELLRVQVKLDPTVSASAVSRLMRDLFAADETEERQHVAELLRANPSFSSGRTSGVRERIPTPPPVDDDRDLETDPSGVVLRGDEETRLKEPEDPSPKTTISRPRSAPTASGPSSTDVQRTQALDAAALERTGDHEVLDEETRALPRPEDAPTIAAGSVSEVLEAQAAAERSAPGPWAYLLAFVVALALGLVVLLVFGPRPAPRPPPSPIERFVPEPEAPPAPAPARGPDAAAPTGAPPSAVAAAAAAVEAPKEPPAAKGGVDKRISAAQKRLDDLGRRYGKARVKLPQRLLADVKDRRKKAGKGADADPKVEEALSALENLLEETAKGFAAEK